MIDPATRRGWTSRPRGDSLPGISDGIDRIYREVRQPRQLCQVRRARRRDFPLEFNLPADARHRAAADPYDASGVLTDPDAAAAPQHRALTRDVRGGRPAATE